MKNTTMKKLAGIAAIAMMATCMMVPMAATTTLSSGIVVAASTDPGEENTETTYKITIKNDAAGHTYEAYQIFAGDLSTNEQGKLVLSNIKWGEGQTTNTAGDDATAAAEALTDANVKEFIDGLTLGTVAGTSGEQSEGAYVIDGLAPGYYLVKDRDASIASTADDAYTAFIVAVVGNAEADVKSAKPEVDKQVLDEVADAEDKAVNGWGETADHAINESFQFKLTAKLPTDSDLDEYEKYKLVFTDLMSTGVTFEDIDSVTVTIGTTVTTLTEEQYDCTATKGMEGDGQTEWTLTIEDLVAIVGEDTSIQNAVVEVVYNAHLNEDAAVGDNDDNKNTVDLQYSNNPNVGGEGSLGQTPPDTVWVFTYEMPNTKVDENKEPLKGVTFKLLNGGNAVKLIANADGTYTVADQSATEGVTDTMTSDANGKFNVIGLDAGTYTLQEVEPLDGYNKCPDVEVVIGAKHIEGEDKASATTTITMTVDGKDATAVEIENKLGSSLPSTGGIGTTLFYVIGGTMVAGAGVYLISKKRMNNNDQD